MKLSYEESVNRQKIEAILKNYDPKEFPELNPMEMEIHTARDGYSDELLMVFYDGETLLINMKTNKVIGHISDRTWVVYGKIHILHELIQNEFAEFADDYRHLKSGSKKKRYPRKFTPVYHLAEKRWVKHPNF